MKRLIFVAIFLLSLSLLFGIPGFTSAAAYAPAVGGTGTTTPPTYGKLLVGNAAKTYTLTATSSLGLPTFADLAALQSFSTTSADFWKAQRNFFSTTSVTYWMGATDLFSTTSTDYWKTQRNFFSTTSADWWKGLNNFFSTSSASYFLSLNQGAAFSTTSASYFLSQNPSTGFATTSADFWKLNRNFFSTTSVDYWKTVTDLFSTTSANYLLSVYDKGFFFSTTSADVWKLNRNFFSTSSADWWKTQNDFFSTTSATYFAHSSTTIPKTYTANTWVPLQTFGNSSTTNASFGTASSTRGFFGGVGIGSTSPTHALSIGNVGTGYGSIAVTENRVSTSTGITIDWKQGNQQLINLGTAATKIGFNNASTSGQTQKIIVCNPGSTAGALTWITPQILWNAAPTQTTAAHRCDVYTCLATQATSTVTSVSKLFCSQTVFP